MSFRLARFATPVVSGETQFNSFECVRICSRTRTLPSQRLASAHFSGKLTACSSSSSWSPIAAGLHNKGVLDQNFGYGCSLGIAVSMQVVFTGPHYSLLQFGVAGIRSDLQPVAKIPGLVRKAMMARPRSPPEVASSPIYIHIYIYIPAWKTSK